ncbi:RHS repeat-associated core domain-containing protein [Pseudomonas sp. C1C7]|uniref:RHS repeat-associated core domain-containing protein n=1 Tax=Pseudomonas sp. C1C7 TaxID=2735272 RepID=UPI0035567849
MHYSIGSDHTQSPALQRQSTKVDTRLLASDLKHSVLNVLDSNQPKSLVYTPYGHSRFGNGLPSLLGFNGERREPLTGWYLLGNGYRAFNPVLMRFNSPDSWSPFGEGGVNAYAYCEGDPFNRRDPTGHGWEKLLNRVGKKYQGISQPRQDRVHRLQQFHRSLQQA